MRGFAGDDTPHYPINALPHNNNRYRLMQGGTHEKINYRRITRKD